jgi:hypothetical protein
MMQLGLKNAAMMPAVSVYTDPAQASAPSSSAVDDKSRKSRRMSALTSAVAQIQAQGGVKRLPKFGFNPEKAAGAGKSRSTFSPAKAPGPTPPPAAPVNVLAAVEDALGDLDALHELLEPRPVPRLNSWDLNKFKSEYPELMEKVKELKLALRSQIERAKRARGEVGPLQEEIAQRFASLAKEVSEQRAAADLANTELVTERRKAEQRAKTIVELKASIEALSADLTEAKQKVANEGLRANTAEASLRERSEDLQSALSAGEDLRVAKDAAAAAAEEAAATASAEIERLVAAFSATTATLEGTRAAAAEKEAELTASLDAQRARTAELEKQLGIALAEASMLMEAKAALDKAHANLSETAAVTRATLESTQKQLDEKSATLLQKDEVRLPR